MARRRVVTGENEQGKAVFVSDEDVEEISVALVPGTQFLRVWAGDATPELPDDQRTPFSGRAFPPPGEFFFGFVTMAPTGSTQVQPDLDLAAAIDELNEKLPGFLEVFESGDSGMHTSDTIDCGVVLSGHPILELDDGETRQLGPGDTYVMRGTRHRWLNLGDGPVVLVACSIGARRTVPR
jgi:mannose-6-phosphate isomerase-like protein (cupin superfamily)